MSKDYDSHHRVSHGVTEKVVIAAYTLMAALVMYACVVGITFLLWTLGPLLTLMVLFGVAAVLLVGGWILWDAFREPK